MLKSMMVALCALVMLGGCASRPISTAGVSVNRTLPERMIDMGIQRQVLVNLPHVMGLSHNHRVAVDAFQGDVLLTGEVPNETAKNAIEQMVKSIREVKKVHNRLKLSDEPKSQSHTVHENYLKTKFLAKLLVSDGAPSALQYHTVVRDDIVYMMGIMTVNQARLASQLARQTDGIMGFVSLMTVLAASKEEARLVNEPMTPQSTPSPSPYIELYQNTNSP